MYDKFFRIFSVASVSLAAVAGHAQWTMFHGNAQRTGTVTTTGPTNPVLKWSVNVGGPVVTSPVIGSDGTVYLGPVMQDGDRPSYDFFAVRPDGTIKWRFKTKFVDAPVSTVSTGALGTNGLLYVGAPDGGFYALRTSDGTVAWKHQGTEPVLQSPVLDSQNRVFVGIDGNMTAFDANGAVLWQHPIMTPRLSGGPALATNGTVYAVGGFDNDASYLYAYEPTTGAQLWKTFLSQYFWPLSTPTVGPSGTVYVATESIMAVNPNGTIKYQAEPTYGLNSFAAIAVDGQDNLYYSAYVYAWKLGPTGSTVWSKLLTGDNSFLGHTYSSFLRDGAGKLFFGLGDGKRSAIPYEKQLLVLNSSTGATMGSYGFSEIPGMSAPALASDGTLYIGNLNGNLYAFR